MRLRQLTFAFADSPKGGKEAKPSDESVGKAHLLRIAKGMPTTDLIAPAADTDQLLKRVASPRNLAKALLNVARNKGAVPTNNSVLVCCQGLASFALRPPSG
jgi:RNA-directed DNA polymerase